MGMLSDFCEDTFLNMFSIFYSAESFHTALISVGGKLLNWDFRDKSIIRS